MGMRALAESFRHPMAQEYLGKRLAWVRKARLLSPSCPADNLPYKRRRLTHPLAASSLGSLGSLWASSQLTAFQYRSDPNGHSCTLVGVGS